MIGCDFRRISCNTKYEETARTSSCFEPQDHEVNETALKTCVCTKLIGAFVPKSPFLGKLIGIFIINTGGLGAKKAPLGFSLAALLQSSHSV